MECKILIATNSQAQVIPKLKLEVAANLEIHISGIAVKNILGGNEAFRSKTLFFFLRLFSFIRMLITFSSQKINTNS